MSIKITVGAATTRYGVTQRTIHRWVAKYEIHQFPDGTYNRDQLDALVDNYENPDYMEVDWNRAACKNLPTDFFYKIEDRGVSKLIDVDVFRFTCAPCPIWKQCLGYATHHEQYGVWGGMTSDEREALLDRKNSDLKTKVFKDFDRYGITKQMIYQAIGKE
jgi:WhiB family transcriptional regulator, redox-sensing transcriptional regulator